MDTERTVLLLYPPKRADFYELWVKQDYKCAICDKELELPQAVTDHDHETGIVRGVLCRACNSGLGFFKDNARLLWLASEYLQLH